MALAVILLSIILMFFMAYTAAVQRTIRALGLLHPRESEGATGTRSYALILLGIYLRRLNAVFLLGMAVYLITSRASTWYSGATIVILCWIGSLLLDSISYLRPGSAAMIAVLVTELERRRERYRKARDAARLQAAEELLDHIRSIPRMQTVRGGNR